MPKDFKCIDPKYRLALVAGTKIKPVEILKARDSDIDVHFLIDNDIPFNNIRAANISPTMLHQRGCTTADSIQNIGADALDLLDISFLSDCISVYGSAELVKVFLRTSYDAVALSNKLVMQMLSLSTDALLRECAGCPQEAAAVLVQLDAPLNFEATTLLDTGLRAPQLFDIGYSYQQIKDTVGASTEQMDKLQFRC